MSIEQAGPSKRPMNLTPWIVIAAVGAALTPLVAGSAIYVGWDLARDARVSEAAALAALRDEIRGVNAQVRTSHAATWVAAEGTVNACTGFNDRFECTVTNVTDEALSACWIGHLAQKQGSGTLTSPALCTGRLGPRETRRVSIPWRHGEADDICNSPGYGRPRLDWSKCEFTSEALDPPPAPASAASAASAASSTTVAATPAAAAR